MFIILLLKKRKSLGIDSLPGSLIEAIEYAEKSAILKETLGEHIFTNLIESKKKEWDDYRIRIFPYELERYLPIL